MSGPLGERDRARLLELARASILQAIAGGPALDDGPAAGCSAALTAPRPAFVTLKGAPVDGRPPLRGCIGDLDRRSPLWSTVVRVAARAATEDPRFAPVTPVELPGLHLEISVLTDPRPLAVHDELVPGRHGVELVHGAHRGVFLPQVAAELGWSREELLRHLALKAGLGETGWRQAELRVFEAEVFGGPFMRPAPFGTRPRSRPARS